MAINSNTLNFVPATERQVAYVRSLLEQREYAGEPINFETLSKAQAGELINTLLLAPRNTAVAGGFVRNNTIHADLRVGMYQVANGDIYRIHESRETGRLYAKKLDALTQSFEYAGGAIYRLTPADRMSLEQAKAFGLETGMCCVCGKFLTDAKSVALGIGPVCLKNF